MHVAEGRRIIGADRKQSQFWRQPPADLTETGKISGIASVVNRMLSGSQYETTVAAVRVFQNPRSPVPRRNVRHGKVAVPRTVPPVKLDNFGEAKIGNQVRHMAGNNDGRGDSTLAQI